MKVSVLDKRTGQEKSMEPRYAKILVGLGRANYLTRDMVATPVAAPAMMPVVPTAVAIPAAIEPVAVVEPVIATVTDEPEPENLENLEDLDAEALHALAKERGVRVHHRAGEEKVREALREAGE